MTDTCKSLEAANEQYSKLSQQVSLSTSAEIRTTGMEEMTSLIENNDLDWHLLQQAFLREDINIERTSWKPGQSGGLVRCLEDERSLIRLKCIEMVTRVLCAVRRRMLTNAAQQDKSRKRSYHQIHRITESHWWSLADNGVDALVEMVYDDAEEVRVGALLALRVLGDNEISNNMRGLRVSDDHLKILLHMLNDSSATFREAARNVLSVVYVPRESAINEAIRALLTNIQHFAGDASAILVTMSALGRRHATIIRHLVSAILSTGKRGGYQEPHIVDLISRAKTILVHSASTVCPDVLVTCPPYIRSHASYVRTTTPCAVMAVTSYTGHEMGPTLLYQRWKLSWSLLSTSCTRECAVSNTPSVLTDVHSDVFMSGVISCCIDVKYRTGVNDVGSRLLELGIAGDHNPHVLEWMQGLYDCALSIKECPVPKFPDEILILLTQTKLCRATLSMSRQTDEPADVGVSESTVGVISPNEIVSRSLSVARRIVVDQGETRFKTSTQLRQSKSRALDVYQGLPYAVMFDGVIRDRISDASYAIRLSYPNVLDPVYIPVIESCMYMSGNGHHSYRVLGSIYCPAYQEAVTIKADVMTTRMAYGLSVSCPISSGESRLVVVKI